MLLVSCFLGFNEILVSDVRLCPGPVSFFEGSNHLLMEFLGLLCILCQFRVILRSFVPDFLSFIKDILQFNVVLKLNLLNMVLLLELSYLANEFPLFACAQHFGLLGKLKPVDVLSEHFDRGTAHIVLLSDRVCLCKQFVCLSIGIVALVFVFADFFVDLIPGIFEFLGFINEILGLLVQLIPLSCKSTGFRI